MPFIGALGFVWAAYTDLRSRTVGDEAWILPILAGAISLFLGEPNINVHIAVISSIALAAVLAWTMARLLKVPWGSADSIGMVMLALILPPPMLVVAMMASGVIAIVTILIFKRRVLKGQATGHSFTVPVVTVFAAGLGVALTVGMWLNYI